MKTIKISADEFAIYKLNKGDLLFNRTNGSIDHVGKTGMFDLDGDYCFASYLIRIVPGPDVQAAFLLSIMNSSVFLSEIRKKAVKAAGQNNINATKMKSMPVPVPSLKEQKVLVDAINSYREEIVKAESVLTDAPTRKQQVLRAALR